MARTTKTVIISDLSGKEVAEEKAVRIVISFADRTRKRILIDASEEEIAELASKGRPARRGRPSRGPRSGTEEQEEGEEELDVLDEEL